MDLVFLGTRGDIEKKTRRHRRHSALFVKAANARILIDCGADWLGRIEALRPTAIVVLHIGTFHPQTRGFGLRWWHECNMVDEYRVLHGSELTDDYLRSPIRGTIERGIAFRRRYACSIWAAVMESSQWRSGSEAPRSLALTPRRK